MSFREAVRTVLMEKYATFSGRATRSEYWWYQLFVILCSLVLFIPVVAGIVMTPVDERPTGTAAVLTFGGLIVLVVLLLAQLVPGLAVTVRRLHDAGFSGWMYLITFVPYVGGLVLLVLVLLSSKPANQWGPNPNGANQAWGGAPPLPPAGWYPDPGGVARLRWWDGVTWTEHVS